MASPSLLEPCHRLPVHWHVGQHLPLRRPYRLNYGKADNDQHQGRHGIATPTPTQAVMVGNCDRFHKVVAGDECGAIANKYGIPVTSLYSWNPAVGNTCASLWADTYICVRTIGFVSPTATTTRTTTTMAGGVATLTPIQTGMVSGCKKFHKVVAGDQCGNLATRYSITLANFYS